MPTSSRSFVHFLLGYEFGLGVVNSAAAISRQPPFRAALKLDDPQVLVANKGRVAVSRGHLRVKDSRCPVRELLQRLLAVSVQVMQV